MAPFPRVHGNQQSHYIPEISHLHGLNTMEFPPPPPHFPELNPTPSIPAPMHPQTVNTQSMNTPSLIYPPVIPPSVNPPRPNPVPMNHPLMHQPTLNPPVGFIHQPLNPNGVPRQQIEVQPLNPPSLYHPPVLEFTFVLEYLGERIAIHTDQPTRFQILYLCNVASSALHNEFSPPNHIFRPMVAPRWLGRVIRVHNDALLRVIVHQCISRREFRLYIWVYFIPHGSLQHLPGMVVNSAEIPVIHDLGGLPRPHQPQPVRPIVSNQVESREVYPLPRPVCNPVDPRHGQCGRPQVSNPVGSLVGQSASATAPHPVGLHINSPIPSVSIAQENIASASEIRNVVSTQAELVIPSAGKEQSNERRQYKCQNCGRVAHSKRTCKLINPILTKASVPVSGEASDQGRYIGPSGDAEVPTGIPRQPV